MIQECRIARRLPKDHGHRVVDEGVEVVVFRFLYGCNVIRDELGNVDSFHDQVPSTKGAGRGSINCSPFVCLQRAPARRP